MHIRAFNSYMEKWIYPNLIYLFHEEAVLISCIFSSFCSMFIRFVSAFSDISLWNFLNIYFVNKCVEF